MSKIAEQKALEAYPEDYAYVKCDNEDTNYTEIDDEGTKWLKVDSNKEFRAVYTKCYDQAMQDFIQWAKGYFKYKSIHHIYVNHFFEQLNNFIQDESEN